MSRLESYLAGQWQYGSGTAIELFDPVTGDILASASSHGLDLEAALAFARRHGGAELRSMTYRQRAALLGSIAELLAAKRDEYFDISLRNSGATRADASFDVDGAIFTLKFFARIGEALGDHYRLFDGPPVALAKGGGFAGQHFLAPLTGVAVLINAYNFPAWGLWEKAAPALLSGVPVFAKPATPTAWLAQRMVADVVAAGLLPAGAISILCGTPQDLLDHLTEDDVVCFTGSARTAAAIRTHANVVDRSIRVNIEADSVNSALLGPDAAPGSAAFDLLVAEVAREMSIKAGQKCTAIRRILAPAELAPAVADAVAGRLDALVAGNPRRPEVAIGPLVNKAQQAAALSGISDLCREAKVVRGDPARFAPVDADPAVACFVPPTLLYCERGLAARWAHDLEVFGPVATVLPCRDPGEMIEMARRGRGSLVASAFSSDADFLARVVTGIADRHGRVMAIDAAVGKLHTGHGNVMPGCLHGGPGRAGGGEELGGLRALNLFHRRHVVQAGPELLRSLGEGAVAATLT